MNKEREMKTLVIAALVISVVAIGVGFAAFSTTLQINGTATVNTAGKTWNVLFTNVEKTGLSTENIDATVPSISNGTAGENTTNTAIGTITAAFTAPKQKLQYKITVTNSGTYNAKLTAASIPTLETITVTGTGNDAATDAANVKKHLKFSFTKADESPVTPETDTLAAGTTQDYLYTIEYEDLTNAAELPKAQVSISIPQTTLTFSQAN